MMGNYHFKKAGDKMKNLESIEQQALIKWAELQSVHYPQLKLLYHIPNGGKRNITTATRLKREGVKSGVPDLCLPVARFNYNGMYIEMKAKKGKTTENQDLWIEALRNQGYYVVIAYGWEEAKNEILKYLGVTYERQSI
jgi:hypothetical protein